MTPRHHDNTSKAVARIPMVLNVSCELLGAWSAQDKIRGYYRVAACPWTSGGRCIGRLPGFLRHPSIQPSRSLTPFVILDRGLRLATCQQRLGPSLARSLPVDVLDRRGRNWKRKGPLLHDGRSVLLFVYLTFTESPQKAKVDGEKQWDLCRKRDSPLISVTSSVGEWKVEKVFI